MISGESRNGYRIQEDGYVVSVVEVLEDATNV